MTTFITHSQRGEDHFIWNNVKDMDPKESRFIDIGAADGVTFSNTRALYNLGWKGVLVEASPLAIPALFTHYGNDPDMTIVHAAIGDRDIPLAKFHTSPDLVSTGSDAQWELWRGTVPFNLLYQPFISAATFYAWLLGGIGVGTRYPVLSIDVEGSSIEVFEQTPLDALGVIIAVVEYDGKPDHLRSIANARGFEVIEQTAENLVLRRH